MHDFMLSHLDVLRANNGKEKVDRYLTAKYDDALGLYIMATPGKKMYLSAHLQRNVPLLKVAQQNETGQNAGTSGIGISQKGG